MIITSAPCMPKESFHCGNAISCLTADLLYRYYKNVKERQDIITLETPWNLHGLPYENLFFEKYGYHGTYDEILCMAKTNIDTASGQVELFIEKDNNFKEHCDTDIQFIEFTKACFLKLVEKKLIVNIENEWFIDTGSFLARNDIKNIFASIKCFPSYHKQSIIKEEKTFNGYYPITKKREFTVKFDYRGDKICINPIFQSFIYPNYLAELYGQEKIDFFVGGSGFSMLKWHYYRQVTSFALTGDYSICNLLFHGTVVGNDNKSMSKHSGNFIQPYDITGINNNKNFLRYVLIRSISDNNISIQLDKSISEFRRIENKLKCILDYKLRPVLNGSENKLDLTLRYLSEYKFNLALETFYVYLKYVNFSQDGNLQIDNLVKKIYYTLFI